MATPINTYVTTHTLPTTTNQGQTDRTEVLKAPSQDTTAQGRARHRRFAGRLFILPGPGGCGFTESSAEAEFGRAAFGGFRVPVSWQGHFAADVSVTFSVRRVRTALWRPMTSRRRWHHLTPSWVPPLADLFGVHVLPETYSWLFWFRIVRFARFGGGYNSFVSLRWLMVLCLMLDLNSMLTILSVVLNVLVPCLSLLGLLLSMSDLLVKMCLLVSVFLSAPPSRSGKS